MAKGRVVFYEEPGPRTQTQPRPVYTGRARRRRRKRRRVGRMLFALAALVLAASVGYVLWYTQAEQVSSSIDPGHGGVNPSIGAEDYGSESGGLRESKITLATARALYELLSADERFAPLLTADGSAYLKPSERGAVAAAAGAQLFLSIHLNYDGSPSSSGFECYAAPPALSTNAESVRFGELLAASFSQLGMELRGAIGVRYLYYEDDDTKTIYESTDTTPRWYPTFTVLSSCGCPAVLCEEGFISNTGDMALLAGSDGCAAAAQCYYESICAYFGLT